MTERERLIKLLEQCSCHYSPPCTGECGECHNVEMFDRQIEHIADHLIANGVIVPPCEVGDTVYETQPIRKRVQAYEITTVKWNGHYFWFTWVLKDGDGIYGNVDGFASYKIGKTVFLAREEAEKALGGKT